MTEARQFDFQVLGAVAILGAGGRMGAWFASLFRGVGLEVLEIERETSRDERHALLQKAGTVIVSVPIAVTCDVISEIVPLLSRETLLCDLTSLKEKPVSAMMQHSGEVLGLHPMCAPTSKGLVEQPIVTCLGREGAKSQTLCQVLESLGARLVSLSAAKHDQLMAVVQGLNHFNSLAFAHALRSIGVSVEESMLVASPVYKLRMQLAGRILAQDPKLYVDIELHNPYVPAVLDHFQNSLTDFRGAIERKSIEDCLTFFKEAADHFGDYSVTAMKESDEVLRVVGASKLPS